MALGKGRLALIESETRILLSAYGITLAPCHTVTSAEEAVEAAEALGFPVGARLGVLGATMAQRASLGLWSKDVVRTTVSAMRLLQNS